MERPPANDSDHHTPETEKEIRERALDQTIKDSFPASDPPSSDPNPEEEDAFDPSAASRLSE